MDEESRRDWLAVAWDTLKHLPPDILASGARKARLQCDHPSKIVPAIIAETSEDMVRHYHRHDFDRPLAIEGPKPDYITPEEAAEILRQYGFKPKRVA